MFITRLLLILDRYITERLKDHNTDTIDKLDDMFMQLDDERRLLIEFSHSDYSNEEIEAELREELRQMKDLYVRK